ncbi:Omp28-related outer membrane protein [Ancylomarina sp. DW003]|nr:Omp28-related outer membrane protein [Ancylomarina sp. DW003]MDE5422724.1 Omp28-related outer membrane protein [Ancylomarina sp. DW003]
MKTRNVLTRILLCTLIVVPFIFACSSDDDDPVTKITLSADAYKILEGVPVSFTVKDNLDNNVTAKVTLTANGIAISNPHTFNAEGVYVVVATLNSLTSNVSITVEDASQATSITLIPSKSVVNPGESIDLQVEDNFGNNVTALSAITVDGEAITTNPYIFSNSGDYTVEATYQGLTTQVTITATTPSEFSIVESFSASGAPASFTKKILLEDFTGTWCPYCPAAAEAVKLAVEENSNKVFGVGIHHSSEDPMMISEGTFFINNYYVKSIPTIFANGADTRWDYPDMTQVNNELAEDASVGLAVSAEVIGGKLDLEVKVGFKSAMTEEIRLMIYVVEDDVTSTAAQQGSDEGINYVHKDVLREVGTDREGDVIPSDHTGAGGVYTKTMKGLSIPILGINLDKLKVYAFVRNTYTKTVVVEGPYGPETIEDAPHYDIYNVQAVNVGTSQDFD